MLRGAVLQRDRWTCRYCGGETAEVDHVEPWARGGSTTPANLVAACGACNREKGIRTPGEWRRDETVEKLVEKARNRPARAYRLKRR